MEDIKAKRINARAKEVVAEMDQEQAKAFLDSVLEAYNDNYVDSTYVNGGFGGTPYVLYMP